MTQTLKRIYPDKPDKVYLYGTCLIDSLYPDSGIDAVALLEAHGIEVIFPQQQSCCGQPAYNSGYHKEAKQVAQSQIPLFSQPIPIVVLSGSCAGMMKHHYPDLCGKRETVEDFAGRIFEFSEFLHHVLRIELEDKGAPINVALHTSCAARREMGCRPTALSLLNQLKQMTLVEHPYESECCGFGGTFAVKHGDISSAMVKDKCDSLLSAGVDTYVSADWGCMMNINGALSKQKQSLQGQHIASFLYQRCVKEN